MTDIGGVTTLVGNGMQVSNVENIKLWGGGGNDRFATLGGHDDLGGGSGDDVLTSGAGDEGLSGGDGRGVLVGGVGDDGFGLENDQDADTLRFAGRFGDDVVYGFEANGFDRLVFPTRRTTSRWAPSAATRSASASSR
jgi:Ca2+-binding RTX toxin-like protein